MTQPACDYSLDHKIADELDEPIELIVLNPVAGVLEGNAFRMGPGLRHLVSKREAKVAVSSPDKKEGAGNSPPELFALLGCPFEGTSQADEVVELPDIAAFNLLHRVPGQVV